MQRNGSVYGSKPGAISIDDLARKIASSPTSEDLLEMETYGEAEVPILFLLDHSGSTRAPFSGAMSRWQVIVRDVMATIRAIRRNEIQSMSSCITVAVFNQRFRFVKFVLDDDDLDVEYDFPVEMSGACVGRAACEVFLRFVSILDESWPIIMKALFAGGESPQVDDDGAEENPLLDKIRNALVSEGVSLSGDETPQALMDKFRALRSRLSMEEDGESSPV